MAAAERLGPPATADAWFFRGLAIHYDQPSEAIESYRRANALRAAQHAFYPAAVLHLARARNQQLYATRRIDLFAEADASLRQLIEHGYYDAYPHYLLSIAHRLAAEVYRGSQETSDDPLCQEHYAQALDWARSGQEQDPNDDRPVTAEAECLESMGRFEEAIAARTRAISLTERDRPRWEGCHYRWRLYYWTGQLDAALDDLKTCAGFAPTSWFYTCIYPALIHAERGAAETALDLARRPARDAPADAQAVLWSATCLRLLGAAEEAAALLAERAAAVDFSAGLTPPQTAEWVQALYVHSLEEERLDELEFLADRADQPWRLWGEAHFHAAAAQLARGDRVAALAGSSTLIGPSTANSATPITANSFAGKCNWTPIGRRGRRYHGTRPGGTRPSWVAEPRHKRPRPTLVQSAATVLLRRTGRPGNRRNGMNGKSTKHCATPPVRVKSRRGSAPDRVCRHHGLGSQTGRPPADAVLLFRPRLACRGCRSRRST